jgi:hypothetical protein
MRDSPPIHDLALVGDRRTAALISRDGTVCWCCLPRLDSGAAFARLLDPDGGACEPALDGDASEPPQRRCAHLRTDGCDGRRPDDVAASGPLR